MAAEMRNWLGKTIEDEIKGAIQWQQTRLDCTTPKHNSRPHVASDSTALEIGSPVEARHSYTKHLKQYSTDGSNLRVSYGGPHGKYLQVIEFTDSKPPYPAILSDGTSQIKAKFSSAAHVRFQKEHGRLLSQETRGGLFLLSDFEIVLSLQNVQDQVTLLVKECYFKGAAGSPAFGRSTHINNNQAIISLLEQLRSLNRKIAGIDEAKIGSEHDRDGGSMVVQQTPNNKRASQSITNPAHIAQAQSSPTFTKQLIPGLTLIGGTNVQSPRGPRKATYPSRALTASKDIDNRLGIYVTQNSGGHVKEDLAIPTESDLHKPAAVVGQTNTTELTNVLIPLTATDETNPARLRTVFVPVLNDLGMISDDVGQNIDNPKTTREGSRFDLKKNLDSKLNVITPSQIWWHGNDFKFVKSVEAAESVSDVQIKLLARPESWQHPLPGSKFPSPNVPVSILQALNDKAGSLLSENIVSNGINHKVIDQAIIMDDESESSYSSEEVASSDWPPSQNAPTFGSHTVLPPDSSAVISSHNQQGEQHPTVSKWKDSGSSPSAATSYAGSETSERAIAKHLPDDDSDLEMEQPHALPDIDPLSMQNDRNHTTSSRRGSISAPLASSLKTLPRISGFTTSSPTSQSTIPRMTKHARGMPDISLSLEAIIPGTFQIDNERGIENHDAGRLQFANNTKSLRTAITTSFNNKASLGRAITDTQPHSPPLSTQSSESTRAPLLKRKQDVTSASDRSGHEARKYLRRDIRLDEASQAVVDPAIAARQARHAFMNKKVPKLVSSRDMYQQSRPSNSQHGPLQQLQEDDRAKTNSPSSYQPYQTGYRELRKPIDVANPPAQTRVELHGSPLPHTLKSGGNTPSHATPRSISIASATLPSLPTHGRKFSNSSSILLVDDLSRARQLSSENEVYDMFTKAYPNYSGSIKHFLGLCRKIHTDGRLHRSLWDDFIVRHKTDYVNYVSKCTEDGDEAMSYEQFYNDQIETPIYNLRVMDPSTLAKAFASDAQSSHNLQLRLSEPIQNADGPKNAFRLENLQPANSTPIRPASNHSPATDRAMWTQGPPFSVSGIGRSSPSNTSGKQDHSTIVNSRSIGTEQDTHIYKEIGTHLRTETLEVVDHEVHMGVKKLDFVKVVSDSGIAPPIGEHVAIEKFTKHTNREIQVQGEMNSSQNAWWQEENTPFKEFVRNYARLKVHGGILGIAGKNAVLDQKVAQLNVLDWRL